MTGIDQIGVKGAMKLILHIAGVDQLMEIHRRLIIVESQEMIGKLLEVVVPGVIAIIEMKEYQEMIKN